jgi:hypothetical protein
MAGSEVALLRQRIADEYLAATWGLTGLAYGTSQHQFLTARAENIGQSFVQLLEVVGSPETAMQMFNDTLQALQETPTRSHLLDLLRRTLESTEDTAQLLEHIQEMWNIIDLLKTRFGLEQAQKIIETPSSVICEREENHP